MRRRTTRLSATGFNSRRPNSVFMGVAAAYSLRIPSGSTYTGPLIIARRSSDNAELAFGASLIADANGNRWLDTTALLAWAGAGSAFVTTWYDQSGFSKNSTQASSALQPTIVLSGTVIVKNGRPSLLFPSAKAFTRWAGTPDAWPLVLNAVVSFDNNASEVRSFVLEHGDRAVNNGVATGASYNTTNVLQSATVNYLSFNTSTTPLAFGALTVTSWSYIQGTSPTLTGWANGVLTYQSGAGNNGAPTGGITIGRRFVGDQFYGNVSEIVITPALTNRQRLELNQGAAFGITVA